MEEQLWFTAFLNKVLGGPVDALMNLLPRPFHPAHPGAPFTNAVAMELLVAVFLIVLFTLVRSRLSVEKPGGLQHVMEMLHEFVEGQASGLMDHGYERHVPLLTAIFLFVLFANLIGVIPGFESPTGLVAVPLGLAVVSFVYYNWRGLRTHGPWGYFKHFLGPVPAMSPLMLVIEAISHLARLLSLTVRLWANIFAGDLVTLAFLSMVPLVLPVVFNMLHIFVALLQAYIFMLMTAIYISIASAEEH